MASLCQIPHQYIKLNSRTARRSPSLTICCGLRSGPPKALWRCNVLSREAIQAIHALKLAAKSSSPDKLDLVFRERIDRLIKSDVIDILAELRKQDLLDLVFQVFAYIRKLEWYKPDVTLYNDMILMVGKKKMIEKAQDLFAELKNEGLEPNTRTYTEMIGAFLKVGMLVEAMNLYRIMKETGCKPDKLTLTILIRNLEKLGRSDLASDVRNDCKEYLDFPKKFLEDVDKAYARKKKANKSCLEAIWEFVPKYLVGAFFPKSRFIFSMNPSMCFLTCACCFVH